MSLSWPNLISVCIHRPVSFFRGPFHALPVRLAGSMRAMQVFLTVQHCSPYHNILAYPARHEFTQGCLFLQHVLQQCYHLALTLHLSFRNLRMLFSSIIILTFLSLCKEIIHLSPKQCKSQNGNGKKILPQSGSTRLFFNIPYSLE